MRLLRVHPTKQHYLSRYVPSASWEFRSLRYWWIDAINYQTRCREEYYDQVSENETDHGLVYLWFLSYLYRIVINHLCLVLLILYVAGGR